MTFMSIAFAVGAMFMAITAATMNNADQFAMIAALMIALIFLAASVLAAWATKIR